MMSLQSGTALWFLILTAPVCLYTVWTDLAFMKIRNTAVLALVVIYAVVGLMTLPLVDWGWGWVSLIVVLALGFIANSLIGFGAGDAKFAAAMAPFVAYPDIRNVLYLLAAFTVFGLITHRIARRIPAVVNATPHWESWGRKDFPLGIALAPTLIAYLALAAFR